MIEQKLEWDSTNWRKVRDARLLEWMAGDQDAMNTILILSQIVEVWDDLIDENQVEPGGIHEAFTGALVDLQLNPFYQKHQGMILATVIVGINAWLDSLDLEKAGSAAERMQAFYIRNYIFEMVNICAFCVGGWNHMRQVSLEMRAFFTHETYDQWEHRK